MLAKMGWTAGQGLGAANAGRTTVVETYAYQEGVGLGAEGGRLGDAVALAESRMATAAVVTGPKAGRGNGFAQEKARARFENM